MYRTTMEVTISKLELAVINNDSAIPHRQTNDFPSHISLTNRDVPSRNDERVIFSGRYQWFDIITRQG